MGVKIVTTANATVIDTGDHQIQINDPLGLISFQVTPGEEVTQILIQHKRLAEKDDLEQWIRDNMDKLNRILVSD